MVLGILGRDGREQGGSLIKISISDETRWGREWKRIGEGSAID